MKTNNRFEVILRGFSQKNILVIGDLLLDGYYWGKTERISPEAPVPIVEVHKTNFNPGGAGNVALNIAKLGSNISILGVIGSDDNGKMLLNLLEKEGIDVSQIIKLDDYQTPIKTRVFAQDQQVVRIDQENNSIKSDLILPEIKELLEKHLENYDGVILADYNKGLFTEEIILLIIELARKLSIPIYVDPKWDNFYEYKNVHFFKPNLLEFQKAIDKTSQLDDIGKFGNQMRQKLNADILLVTRGADGATLFTNEEHQSIPTESHSVHDVSGAGDTVISAFALADLCGASASEAANIANVAASIVCGQVGVVPIQFSELLQSIRKID